MVDERISWKRPDCTWESQLLAVDFITSFEDEERMKSNTWKLHSHSKRMELWIYLSGEMNVNHNGEKFSPIFGDIHFYSLSEPHCGIVLKPCLVSRVNFYFTPDSFSSLGEKGKSLLQIFDKEMNAGRAHMLRLPQKQLDYCMSLLKEIKEVIQHKPYEYDFIIYADIIRLLVMLNGEYFHTGSAFPTSLPEPVRRACDLIDTYCPEAYNTLAEISDALHINASYLSSLFSKSMSLTLTEYINLRKLSRSRYLLTGGKNVTEACYESGFNSLSYFIKLFRRTYGVTPRHYLNMAGNAAQKD